MLPTLPIERLQTHDPIERLEGSVSEMQLETEMLQRSIDRRREEREELMVEQDILQLEIQRLRQLLSDKSSEVATLERKKGMLQCSIKEKKQELLTQQDCLKYELKNIKDDVHRVKHDLNDRQQRAEKLRMKYETMTSKKESVYDEGPKSQTYHLIRAAQEKEELKKEGERLQGEIQRAEKEVCQYLTPHCHLSLSWCRFQDWKMLWRASSRAIMTTETVCVVKAVRHRSLCMKS